MNQSARRRAAGPMLKAMALVETDLTRNAKRPDFSSYITEFKASPAHDSVQNPDSQNKTRRQRASKRRAFSLTSFDGSIFWLRIALLWTFLLPAAAAGVTVFGFAEAGTFISRANAPSSAATPTPLRSMS